MVKEYYIIRLWNETYFAGFTAYPNPLTPNPYDFFLDIKRFIQPLHQSCAIQFQAKPNEKMLNILRTIYPNLAVIKVKIEETELG